MSTASEVWGKHFYLMETVHGTWRVWVGPSLPQTTQEIGYVLHLREVLNELSIWRGADKVGGNYISWEFGSMNWRDARDLLRNLNYQEVSEGDPILHQLRER